jgi:menaquinone-dependent protoporphyrinogen IX oxidase
VRNSAEIPQRDDKERSWSQVKGAVVYYSRYGNNERTAKAVLQGLEETGHEVDLINAKERKDLQGEYDFVVVGSPTRAGRTSGPVKKFMKKNLDADWEGKPFAAFGTCMNTACEKGEPTAAGDIHKELVKKGLKPAAEAFDSGVSGMKGPLVPDGEEKAREFGRQVGKKLSG